MPLLEDGGIEAFIRREVLPYTPDAWIKEDATKIGYEVSFTRHFYKPQPLRTLEEISADILAIEKEAEGLLDGLLKGRAAFVKKATSSPGAVVHRSAKCERGDSVRGKGTGSHRRGGPCSPICGALIQSARQRIATVANSTQTLLCWHVGRRLLSENLQRRPSRIWQTDSRDRVTRIDGGVWAGFSYAELARMIQFAAMLSR